MLGVWSVTDEDERESLAYLIRNLPADGRIEVEIRQAAPTEPQDVTALQIPQYAGGSYGITHVDVGLLRLFRDTYHARSLLDVGCGPGGQVQAAIELGYRTIGLDVDPRLYRKPGVALIDLCIQPVILPAPADVVWSVETAEHLPLGCVPAYVETLTRNARLAIVLTASQEELPQHLTIKPRGWWVEQIEAGGDFMLDPLSAKMIREHSTMQREFLRETGMVFWRSK